MLELAGFLRSSSWTARTWGPGRNFSCGLMERMLEGRPDIGTKLLTRPCRCQSHRSSLRVWSPPLMVILLMEEILHQLIGSFSHYLQGFIHPRWCRISSINSTPHTWPCGWVGGSSTITTVVLTLLSVLLPVVDFCFHHGFLDVVEPGLFLEAWSQYHGGEAGHPWIDPTSEVGIVNIAMAGTLLQFRQLPHCFRRCS